MNRFLFLALLLLILGKKCYAQDLGKLKELSAKKALKKGISITGLVSGDHTYYNASGIDNRNIPFVALYRGSLVVDILGKIKMPVTFSLSNQSINWSHPFDKNYQFMQPFNRLVLKPTYKGFTMQIGTCSMNFSPYSLSGHRYDGIGLQYKSAKKTYYFGFMLGNLQRAVLYDFSQQSPNNQPSYKETGVGIQAGYRKKQDKIEVIFFTAKDKSTSITPLQQVAKFDSIGITAKQNAVISLKGDKVIYKKLVLSAEFAVSALTNNLKDTKEAAKTSNILGSLLSGIITTNGTTNYRNALKVGIAYQGKTFTSGLEYSRVDPEYKTLGAYYFVNDMETMAAKVSTQLLQGKLNLSGNVGIQQNLSGLKLNKRVVGATTLTYVPNEAVNVFFNYSNFSNYSNLRSTYDYLKQVTPYQILDTLNFRQINQNIQTGVLINLPSSKETIAQHISTNVALQRGQDKQGSTKTTNNLSNYSLEYGYMLKPKKLNLTTAMNYSASNISGIAATDWGPSVGITKGFGEKWKSNTHFTYIMGKMTGVENKVMNIRVGLLGKMSNTFGLNFNFIYLNRQAVSADRFIPSFKEFTATAGFIYNFTVLKGGNK